MWENNYIVRRNNGFCCHTFPFALQLNKNFAKLRHSAFKNFLSFKSLLGWSLRFFLGFSFFEQSNWWTKQAIKPVFSPLCSQVFVTCRFFTLFYPSGKKLSEKNFESGAKAATWLVCSIWLVSCVFFFRQVSIS